MIKNFSGYIMLNWKTKEMKVRKKMPYSSSMNGNWIPIKVNINLRLPEEVMAEIKGDITLPEKRIENLVLEAL